MVGQWLCLNCSEHNIADDDICRGCSWDRRDPRAVDVAARPVCDRDRLRSAFASLRDKGYWARGDQSHGWKAVPVDVLRRSGKVVFWYDTQTAGAFNRGGNLVGVLYLDHFDRDAGEIAGVLQEHGLGTNINERRMVVVVPAVP